MNSEDKNIAASRLALNVRSGGVDTLTVEPDGRRVSSIDVESSIIGEAKVLEEAVYAAPALLGDYAELDIVVDSRRFMIVPDELTADTDLLTAVAARLWPEVAAEDLTVNHCRPGVAVVSVVEASMRGFVSRTFVGATVINRIAALINYFSGLSKPVNRVKLYANFADGGRLDIVCFSSDGLMMANTFDYHEMTDAVYYIMAAVKDCGLDELDDEVIVCGNSERSAEATPMLREYLNSVMPLLLTADDNVTPLELLYFIR